MNERKEFEKWYEGYCLPGEADWFRRGPLALDEYEHGHTQEAWEGWQARAALAAKAVPAGWKLVPVEPTQAMHHAGIKAMPSDPNAAHWWAGYPLGCWAAMLAAAPAPEATPAQAQQADAPIAEHLEKHLPTYASKHPSLLVRQLATALMAATPEPTEPVGEVAKESDYWSRGHFYEGRRHVIRALKNLDALPLGTKLFAAPVAQAKPCRSPYCECEKDKCTHPGFYDARGT